MYLLPKDMHCLMLEFWDLPGSPVAETVLPLQRAWVQFLVRELDPVCHN